MFEQTKGPQGIEVLRALRLPHPVTIPDLCGDRVTLDRYVVRVPVEPRGVRTPVYYWADPAGRRRVGEQGLARSRAGRAHLIEMVPLDTLLKRLGYSSTRYSREDVASVFRRTGVPEYRFEGAREREFVRVPLEVWGATEADVLRDWFQHLVA